MQNKDARTQFLMDFILLHVNNSKCCVEVTRFSTKSRKQNDVTEDSHICLPLQLGGNQGG